jgi:hypothetical protein
VPGLEPAAKEPDVRLDELGAEELRRAQLGEAVAGTMGDEKRPGCALGGTGRMLVGHVRRV